MSKKMISLIIALTAVMCVFCNYSFVFAEDTESTKGYQNVYLSDIAINSDVAEDITTFQVRSAGWYHVNKIELGITRHDKQTIEYNIDNGYIYLHLVPGVTYDCWTVDYNRSMQGIQNGSGQGEDVPVPQNETTDDAQVAAPIVAKVNDILVWIALIAVFVCVIKIIHIGILFMLTGVNDRNQAKTAILPWTIGAMVSGGYFVIGKTIINMLAGTSGAGNMNGSGIFEPNADVVTIGGNSPRGAIITVGQTILGIIAFIAAAVAVGMAIYIGIRYMTKGAGGMAKVKTTLLPYFIGAIIVGGATAIAGIVLGLMQ